MANLDTSIKSSKMHFSRILFLLISSSCISACAAPVSYQYYSCEKLQAEALSLEARSKKMSGDAVALAVLSLEAASERKSCNIRYK